MAGPLGISGRFPGVPKGNTPEERQAYTQGRISGFTDDYIYARGSDGQMAWHVKPGHYGEEPSLQRQPITSLSQRVTGNIDSFQLGGDFQQTTPGKGNYKFKYYSVVWFWASSRGNYDLRVEAGIYYYVREEEQYDTGIAESMLSQAMQRSNWLNGAPNIRSFDVNRITGDSRNFHSSSVGGSDSEYRAGGFFGRSENDISLVEFNRPQFVLTYKDRKVEEFSLGRNQYQYLKF